MMTNLRDVSSLPGVVSSSSSDQLRRQLTTNNNKQKKQQIAYNKQMPMTKDIATSRLKRNNRFKPKLKLYLHDSLVKTRRPRSWITLAILLGALICLNQSIQLFEAKIHHSKRQAPVSNPSSPSLTGRENTNWWNLWWQQYINEAVQPTVRPIVALSFNGRTINLSDQQQSDLSNLAAGNSVQQFQPAAAAVAADTNQPRDVDTNFVLTSPDPGANPVDIERNEKLRLIASSLPDNMHPFAAKQMMLAQQKSAQQQTNWQSVKPTIIIQPSPQSMTSTSMRDARLNRQASMYQPLSVEDPNQNQVLSGVASEEDESSSLNANMGIQMRAAMNRQQQQQDRPKTQVSKMIVGQQQTSLSLSSPASNLLQLQMQQQWRRQQPQQQQLMEDTRFEQQQQNQMVDYSEDNEPELDSGSGSGNANRDMEGNDQTGRAQPSNDSSSSSLMAELQAGPKQFGLAPAAGMSMDMVTQSQPSGGRKSPPAMQPGGLSQQPQQPSRDLSGMEQTTSGSQDTGRQQQQQPGFIKQQQATTQTKSPMSQQQPVLAQSISTGKGQQEQQMTTTTVTQQPRVITQRPTTSTPGSARPSAGGQSTTTTRMKSVDRDESTSGINVDSVQQPTAATSTAAPTTTTSTTKAAAVEVDLNETPISIEQQQPKMTTPTGRVELENGRPATGMRQQPTTTSARLPTKMTTSFSSSPTADSSPKTTTQLMTTTTTTFAPTVSSSAATTGGGGSTTRPSGSVAMTTTTAMLPTTTSSNESGEDSSDDGDDDDTSDLSSGSGSGTNLMNATGETDSDDSGDDSDNENEQEPTTTIASTSSSLPVSTTPSSAVTKARIQQATSSTTTTGAEGAKQVGVVSSTTTQQPSLTTIDIERLPKNSMQPAPMVSMSMIGRASTPTATNGQQAGSSTAQQTGADDISRIRPTTASSSFTSTTQQPQQQQTTNAKFVMMTLDQAGRATTTIDGDTPITMPMDTLMKMMMNQVVQNNERLQTVGLDQTTTTTTQPPTTTTQSSVTTTASRQSTTTETGVTERPATMEVTQQQSSSTFAPSTGPTKQGPMMIGEDDSMTDDLNSIVTSKKKLQPPPTTRTPGSRPQQSSSATQQQTNIVDNLSTTSDAITTTTPAPQQKTMVMVNLEPTSMTPGDESGGREPKVELLNLDLVPIQRIMNNQMPSRTEIDNRLNMITQAATRDQLERQQQQQPFAVVNDTRRGQQQQQVQQMMMMQRQQGGQQDTDQFMPEVEPGMRLRPATSGQGATKTSSSASSVMQTGGRQVPPMSGVNNQANTVYMIMMNSLPTSEAHSKKPISPQQISMMGTMMSSQRPQQPIQTTSTKTASTATSVMMMQRLPTGTKTMQPPATSTWQQQQKQLATTGSMMISSGSPQMRTTQLVPMTTTSAQQQTNLPNTKSPIRLMSTTAGQQQQTTFAPMSTTGRPRTTFMDNAIEMMEQRQKDATVSSMRKMTSVIMSDNRESQQSSTIGNTVTTTTTQASIDISSRGGSKTTGQSTSDLLSQTGKSAGTTTTSAGQSITTTTSSPVDRFTTTNTTTTKSPFIAATSSSATVTPSGAFSSGLGSNQTASTTQAPSSSITIQQQQRQQIEEEDKRRTTSAATSTTTNEAISTQQTSATTTPLDNQQVGGGDSTDSGSNRVQFERIQQQQPASSSLAGQANVDRRPQQQQVGTKTQASKIGKPFNSTSSFIPSKLRTDFNKFSRVQPNQQQASAKLTQAQSQAQTDKLSSSSRKQPIEGQSAIAVRSGQEATATAIMTTTQSPMVQNMAIRQFGGANRMSALANQPVPFGRPVAMTMQSSSRSSNLPTRVELPSFEYGPSIAVRRPDEPLSNGQIPNCTLTGKNFCVLTKDYPMNEVRQAVERSFRSVRIMYEELQTVSDQELHKDDFNTTNNQAASGKFACQTQVEMMRPGWAKDEITKEWMLVVNTDVFPQRVRTESCAQPNTPCEFIAPFYDSTCQQRYSLHRMIAIDPHDPSRSPQVAVFKFPAGCVCRVHPIRKTTTIIQTTTPITI